MSRTIESQQQQLLALAKRVVDLEAAYLAQGKLIDELLAQHKSALPSDQHGTGEKK